MHALCVIDLYLYIINQSLVCMLEVNYCQLLRFQFSFLPESVLILYVSVQEKLWLSNIDFCYFYILCVHSNVDRTTPVPAHFQTAFTSWQSGLLQA